jgi:hypothetical protein
LKDDQSFAFRKAIGAPLGTNAISAPTKSRLKHLPSTIITHVIITRQSNTSTIITHVIITRQSNTSTIITHVIITRQSNTSTIITRQSKNLSLQINPTSNLYLNIRQPTTLI